MKVAILTFGTRGDVQPYVVVADELRRRGHDVTIAACSNLVPMVEQAGFRAVAIPIDSQAFFDTTEGRAILAAGKTTRFLKELGREETAKRDDLDQALISAADGADVVVATILTITRATSIVEATGAALVCAYTFPEEPTGDYPSPFLVAGDVPTRALRRLTHRLFEQVFWQGAKDNTTALRSRLGLPARVANPLATLRRERHPVLLMAGSSLFERPADWPEHCRVVGPVAPGAELRTAWGEVAGPTDLHRWLDDGEPPVYFGFGSMPVLDPAASLALVADVAGRLGVRALVGAGWSDVPAGASHDGRVFVVGAFDHDTVLPRCRAAVHHGGAGTAQAVARAGLPSVVAHVFADQSLWGRRVRDLGIGASFRYPTLTADRLEAALRPLLAAEVRAEADRIGAALRAEPSGAVAVADAVEAAASAVRQRTTR